MGLSKSNLGLHQSQFVVAILASLLRFVFAACVLATSFGVELEVDDCQGGGSLGLTIGCERLEEGVGQVPALAAFEAGGWRGSGGGRAGGGLDRGGRSGRLIALSRFVCAANKRTATRRARLASATEPVFRQQMTNG